MGHIPLDLPPPAALRGRWAASAAIAHATGHGTGCWADGPLWHYDDGGGNWLQLHHTGRGRAVLLGHDHECSPEPEETPDLLAGAPPWWHPPVREAVAAHEFLGFVYGFDGTGWWRAPYDVHDGFTDIGLPALSAERTRQRITDACSYDPTTGRHAPHRPLPQAASIDALIAADAEVDATLVAAVIGPHGGDPQAGAAAARAFLGAP
ncbi:proteophosphoglycan 5 [Streptomyces carpaticus]|uniref:Proteophosphoglycan 5 n=1 Tax=Streptomyces carpaticus TaxID=285558 RepID=A0ABV4ZU82_9ACTN